MGSDHLGPVDHGFREGEDTVVAIRPVSGAATGRGMVLEDRNKRVALFEPRYVFPISVLDDNGKIYYYQPCNLNVERIAAVRSADDTPT